MKNKFLVFTILFISVILIWNFWECHVIFKGESLGLLSSLLTQYMLIGILIERFVTGVFQKDDNEKIFKSRNIIKEKKIERKEIVELQKFQIRINHLENKRNSEATTILMSDEANILSKDIIIENSKLEKLEINRNSEFNTYALLIGLLVASAGFRFFNNIAEVVHPDDIINFEILFVGLDIFLTSILFAGGSRLFLELIDGFTIKKD